MKLSIVVPCYNEEGNVEIFYDEVYKIFKNKKITYEIVFINDGSRDKTLQNLNKLLELKKQNMKILNFSRNFGKEAAMYAGLKESSGELVTIIDADLQQRTELILQMLNILETKKEYDSVAAFQERRKESKILCSFKSLFYKIINAISIVNFVEGASDFRIFRRNVVDSILEVSEYNRFSKGIFSFVGFNTYYMPYTAEKRRIGITKWNPLKLFNYAIDGIVAFTTAPLRIPFIISFILIFTSILLLFVFLIKGITEFRTLLVILLFLMGIQFVVLGLIGEYLSKTYLETKRRPLYIIKDIKESKKEVGIL